MGSSNFTPKYSGQIFYAAEVNAIYSAIMNIENAINMTVGTSSASIPSANIHSLDAAKLYGIGSITGLTTNLLTVTGTAELRGPINLTSTAALTVTGGSGSTIITLGRYDVSNNLSGLLVSDGIYTNLLVDSTGNVSVRGIVTALSGSSFTGAAYITSGNISGNITIGGSDGITLSGSTSSIAIGSNGKITAGAGLEIKQSGISLTSGTINVANKVVIDTTGKISANNIDLTNKLTASTASVGGIAIASSGISTANLSITADGHIYAKTGTFSQTVQTQQLSVSGDIVVNGDIVLPNLTLSDDGIYLTQGAIDVGSGKFRVVQNGSVVASAANILGNLIATTAEFLTSATIGDVVINSSGVTVGGSSEIRVTSSNGITSTTGPIKIASRITIGPYNGDFGILIQSTGGSDIFKIDTNGSLVVAGTFYAPNASITSTITANTGTFTNINLAGVLDVGTGASINIGTSTINSGGISLSSGSISISDKFSVNSNGKITATSADVSGTITATDIDIDDSLSIGNDISMNGTSGTIVLGSDDLIISKTGIIIADGTIDLGNGNLVLDSNGDLFISKSVSIASVGALTLNVLETLTVADNTVVDEDGIHITNGAGMSITGGDLSLNQGYLIAGDPDGAHIKIGHLSLPDPDNPILLSGGNIYCQNDDNQVVFAVNKTSAIFRGEITALTGRILGQMAIGDDNNIYIQGSTEAGIIPGIYLYGVDEFDRNIMRLDCNGLYISRDGGRTWDMAISGSGANANTISNGYLTISDDGAGASGVIVKQWNGNEYREIIRITPAGMLVDGGNITVRSDQTGEVLIGGGYLRLRGLDMGVVTSNNFVANGNFNLTSEKWGLRQKTKGEVFLGAAHSHGGAVSNPTYHYVGWPDDGLLGAHEAWTYDLDQNGIIPDFDPSLLHIDLTQDDRVNHPELPLRTRVTFNPQWVIEHPTLDWVVVPNDACNWVIVLDKNGNEYHKLLAWRSGLYGAAFTPNGTRMVVCGDDIDRKRAPWDVIVFDTSDPDPKEWKRIGTAIPVGEFPCHVACTNTHAFVTICNDGTIIKINLQSMKVEDILLIPQAVPKAIWPHPNGQYIYTAGVVSDRVYKIDVNTFQVVNVDHKGELGWSLVGDENSYPSDLGWNLSVKAHDIKISPDGNRLIIAAASISDGCIILMDANTGELIDYISSAYEQPEKFPYLPASIDTDAEKKAWNYRSVTIVYPHPTLPIIYAAITNRCRIGIVNYANDTLTEITRRQAGSNVSGACISHDGTKLYTCCHHYHTYPLGANRVWGYDVEDGNFYCTADIFDTTQKIYHYSPCGIVTTNNDRYVWVVNEATNELVVIDSEDWANEAGYTRIDLPGDMPYMIIPNHNRSKLFVTNRDLQDNYTPDIVTIIDVATRTVERNIEVADIPTGIEYYHDGQNDYLFVACSESNLVQKIDIAAGKVVDGARIPTSPRHVKLVYNKLYITSYEADKLYCIDRDTMEHLVAGINTNNGPDQMTAIGNNLYVVCQGHDSIDIFDTTTNQLTGEIKVGSMPKAIAYNPVENVIYVANSGEGSVCVIDPDTNTVESWLMTGDTAEFITVNQDGKKWYCTAHGPQGIVYYGENEPYTGDAYLDSSGQTHKYGAEYWMPTRSDWYRADDGTLTGFSSVEFWPNTQFHDKLGYAYLTVMGRYDAYAQIEQDVYPLANNSDGSSEFKTEIIELSYMEPLKLAEDIADFRDIPGIPEEKLIRISPIDDPQHVYVEDYHFSVNYENSTVTRIPMTSELEIPPSPTKIMAVVLNGTDWVQINPSYGIARYNTIEVLPVGNIVDKFIEGTDYELDRVNSRIRRIDGGDIYDGDAVDIVLRHLLKARYYYHPNKRNYDDVVLSANFMWRWPRPENQWVRMEIDEMVPRYIIVDNDNIDPWLPTFDRVQETQKGLRYSSMTDRMEIAVISSSTKPISGSVDDLRSDNNSVIFASGEQSVTINLGAVYYINEIHIDHGISLDRVKVEITTSRAMMDWQTIYDQTNVDSSYVLQFEKQIGADSYFGPKRILAVRITMEDDTQNRLDRVKIMGDWKANESYNFAGYTLWDSEGYRENYVVMTGTNPVRFDYPTPVELATDTVRHKLYYTTPQNTIEIEGQGYVTVHNMDGDVQYVGRRMDVDPVPGTHYDFVWNYMNNTIVRTVDSNIQDGEKVYVVYKFVQEDMSRMPLSVGYRDPDTGEEDPDYPPSVAETDVTGAWVEWEFENNFRCNWYVGWISDIGMGSVNVYVDDELIHSISQAATSTERYSMGATDLKPGKHKIRIVQERGRVNFDVIKLEDYQLYYTNSQIIASPNFNPVELLTWYPAKMLPQKARKYLGRGAQTQTGAYYTPLADKNTRIPNYMVPIKYRVKFKTSLEGRGEPTPGGPGAGGELGDRLAKFERGSVMITGVTLEKGVNPTYWRMAPGQDTYPGFQIQPWDPQKPLETGIQGFHIANEAIDKDKLKKFEILDIHVASDAQIQEHKLLLNHPTHPHSNKSVLDQITQGHIDTLDNLNGAGGDITIGGDLTVEGDIIQPGKYNLVYHRPIYGIGGDLEYETTSTNWETFSKEYNLFNSSALPPVPTEAQRYFRLYMVYGDNATGNVYPWIRIVNDSDSSVIYQWKLDNTNGSNEWRKDVFSAYFTAPSADNCRVEARLQNEAETFTNPDHDTWLEIHYIEIQAFDVY